MKSANESPPSNQPTNDVTPGAVKQKPAIEPPTQPFINLSGDGPVDPTKFQCFVLPQEFIEKANAVELPRVKPDDFNDSEPPHTVTPISPITAKAANANEQTRPKRPERTTKREGLTPPEPSDASQDTVMIHRRRKSALIPREVLDAAADTQAEPKRSWRMWMLWGIVGVVVLLIWFLSREKDGGEENAVDDSHSSAPLPSGLPVIGNAVAPSATIASLAAAEASSAAPAASVQAPIVSEALPEVVDIDSPDAKKTQRTPRLKSAPVGTATKSMGVTANSPIAPRETPAPSAAAPAASTPRGKSLLLPSE